MTTKKANNNDVITAKALATIKKDINAYRDSFKNAVTMMLEVSANNKDCKRVCNYLGITSESIKAKNIAELRKNVLDKLPIYYTIEGSGTHFPARLQKINKHANINGFIAVKDSYINALLSLAKILSDSKAYDMKHVELTFAEIDESGEYTPDTVSFTAYDKTGSKIESDKQSYVDFLNRNKLANQVANEAKAAYLSTK